MLDTVAERELQPLSMNGHAAEKERQATPVLLSDDQVIDFVIRGYITLQPQLDAGTHAQICREFDRNGVVPVDLQNDPLGLNLHQKAPTLERVLQDPVVHGATLSLLGPEPFLFGRYCHANGPGQGGVSWHQDDVNVRHYQLRRLMVLYYPQEVTVEMGPTYVVPGTHLLNCPSARMQTYGNFRDQLALTVPAGTVILTHYDLWHSASHNRSDRMRYMVKYYVDRTGEPEGPYWQHHPEEAIPLAMNRMHFEAAFLRNSEWYKERHLRWRLWSYLLGKRGQDQVVWEGWAAHRPQVRSLAEVAPEQIQGYIGSPLF